MASIECEVDAHGSCIGCRCSCHTRENFEDSDQRTPRANRGAPLQIPADIRRRIHSEHVAGRSYRAIARGLNEEGVPTVRAKSWYPATIRKVVLAASQTAQDGL